MKFILFFVFYHLLQISTISQVVDPLIKEQCEFIGKAELSIIDEEYKQAISNYRMARNFAPLDNTSTLNNILCHIKIGDIDSSVNMAIELCYTGFPVSFFNRLKFKALDTRQRWLEFKSQNINNVTHYENNRISKLVELDQYIRHNELGYDSTHKIQSALLDSTVKIFKENGFNTRRIEGYKLYNDTTILGTDFTILVVHALRIQGDEFHALMVEALSRGKIDPYSFASYSKIINPPTNNFRVGCNNPLNAVFYQVGHIIYTCDDALKEQSDFFRANLGLLPLDDVIRLSEHYYEKSKDFYFNNLFNMYAIRNEPIYVKDHDEALTNGRIYKVLEEDVDYFK